MIDILVQPRRDQKAAKRFFRKLLKGQGRPPWQLVTDKLRSYSAAHREVMPSVVHDTDQYRNNLAEVSHEPTRQRERQMRKFKTPGQAQRFLSVHGLVQNLFRVGRHLLQAHHHRELRDRAFIVWQDGQLRDIPDIDSLYFTMLNHNKRSVALNPKTEAGKKNFTRLLEECELRAPNQAVLVL